MNIFEKLLLFITVSVFFISCDEGESYADLLEDETAAVNNFLACQRIENSIPEDSIFQYGPNAPYYRMEKDGNIYMQVIKPGSKDNMAKKDETIFFRFTRYDLFQYVHEDGKCYNDSVTGLPNGLPEGFGNANDFDYKNTSFKFGNYSTPSSASWGTAIQLPLYYLGIDCEVNIVVKSQFGYTDEISNVVPYLYNVRYFKSQI